MQQGKEPASLCQVRRTANSVRLYPCSITGAAGLGYSYRTGVNPVPTCSPVQLGGPFDFCAFALLSELLLGSLEIALKCTRPRQRICSIVGQYSMTEERGCQEEEISSNKV